MDDSSGDNPVAARPNGRMKILVVQDHLRSGGTERQSCLLANAFKAAGHDVTLLTFRPGGALAHAPAPDVGRIGLQRVDFGWDWFAPGLIRHSRAVAPDVVLCLGRMANCWAGWIAQRLPAARVVATVRTGKSLPWAYRWSLRTVNHVVANSAETGRHLVGSGAVARERLSVIPNALVFPPLAQPDPEERQSVRDLHGANPATLVFLWVGMFRPEKNHRALIEHLAQLPSTIPWQLWLAGDGPTRPEIERLARSLGILERVRFLGFVADPTPLYLAADAALMTSRRESLSNFLIEAHAHGLPSLAYAATGVPECGGVTVPMDDEASFRIELRRLIDNPDWRHQEGKRLAAFAREEFSTERRTSAYLSLFHRLISPPA